MSGELEEREWTDERGTHYEAKIVTANGFIVSKKVTMLPHLGWGQRARMLHGMCNTMQFGLNG